MKINLLLNVLNIIMKVIYTQYLKDTGKKDGDITVSTTVDTHIGKSASDEADS